jgi:hypothetical protein
MFKKRKKQGNNFENFAENQYNSIRNYCKLDIIFSGYNVFKRITMKSIILWNMTPCIPTAVHGRFGRMYCLRLQSQRVCQVRDVITNIMFLDIIHRPVLSKTPSCFYLKIQRFGDWILSPSWGKTHSFGPNSGDGDKLYRLDTTEYV